MSTKTIPAEQAGLEHKAAPTVSPVSGLIEADDATGVVEAIVSVTGLLDEDKDVIKPGAYAKTLTKRKPKGIFHHDWHRWVARTEAVEELMPGDGRLPERTKDGQPWPEQAGGLYVKARFNLNTREGKDAYENVKFFSESGECEWSVGYKVPPGKSVRTKSGERHIEEMDLFEFSPVLFGAAPLSGTLSVKSAAMAVADAVAAAEDSFEEDLGISEEDLEALEAAVDQIDLEGLDGGEEEAESSEEDEGGTEEEAEGKAATINTGGVNNDAQVNPNQDVRDFSSQQRSTTNLVGRTRSFINALDQEVRVHLKDNGFYEVHVNNQIQFGPNDRSDLTADEVEGVLAKYVATDLLLPVDPKPGDLISFRGANGRVVGVDSDERGERSATVDFFGSEARTIPVGHLSRPLKTAKGQIADTEVKMPHESLDRSPKKNWVEKAGQLPAYIQHIAKDISEEQGVPLERAIPMAISAVKRWAAGGDDVKPDTQAKAAAAVAEWEKLKARSHAKKGVPVEADTVESEHFPHLPGTYEELREQIREGAIKALSALSADVVHVEVMGTWPGSAVVTAYHSDHVAKSYEIPYSITIGGDEPEVVELDEPMPVELKVSVGGQEEDDSNLLPYPSVIDGVALDLKAILGLGEAKAGRVLSGVNERRLLAAVENLVAVLAAAGLEVNAGPRQEQEEEERQMQADAAPYQDSTAPSARTDAFKALLTPSLLARGYRVLGEALAEED